MSDFTNPAQDTPIPEGFVPEDKTKQAPPDPGTPAVNDAAPDQGAPATDTPPAQEPTQPPAVPELPPLPEKTGDAALDIALTYMVSKGIKTDDPAVALARTTGDFSALQAKLAAAGATDAEPYLEAARAAYARFKAKADAQVAEITKDAESACKVVGATWEQVKTWAGKEATPEEKAQINDALAAGGVQAKATLKWLAEAYSRANPTRGKPVVDPGKPSAATATAGITAREYAEGVEKLYAAKGFRDITGTPEYKALQARRLAGKAAGI